MSNKFLRFGALALVSLFALTGCNNDEVVAKPTGYDDGKILNPTDYDEEIHDNLMSIIYDGIHDGTLGKEVLNKVLYQYSLSIFGAFNEQVKERNVDEITLSAAYTSAKSSDKAVAKTFIQKHKAYWTTNNDGEHVDADGNKIEGDDFDPSDAEYNRVIAKYENIEKRIAKKMYAKISGGSYSKRSIFYESDFLMSLRSSRKNVASPLDAGVVVSKCLLHPDVEDYQVFTSGILHYKNYSDAEAGFDYIETDIVPDIYNELLVEQYVLESQYNALGRSYARKVNVVSISTNSDYPLAANYLVNEFVERYITKAVPNATSVAESTNKVDLDTLKVLSNAWKGSDLDLETSSLLAEAGFEKVSDYYLGTEYGDLMERFDDIVWDDLALTDSAAESEFTGSNSYSLEFGKVIKQREITLRDHTQTGWYLKNGGLSDLPSSIRDSLFSVGTANALLEKEETDEKMVEQDRWHYDSEGATWTYAKPENESPYVAKINGAYFLKNSDVQKGDIYKDIIHYVDGTYYIVQVVEAASSAKLSKTNENRYAKSAKADQAEAIIDEICELVADSDNYKTLSTKHWLEEAGINYHDQVVYDYFKSNYPELFE